MIDEDFNIWLIECNTNPSIVESAKYLEQLIPRMIEDMIKLTVDSEYNYFYHQVI
jgi:tubulin monoglycylase TTLL3/8